MYWYCSGSKSWPTLDTIISFVFANLIGMNCDLIGVLICVCSITSTGEHMWGPHGRQWGREHRWKVREKKNKLETTSSQESTSTDWQLLKAVSSYWPWPWRSEHPTEARILRWHTHLYRHACLSMHTHKTTSHLSQSVPWFYQFNCLYFEAESHRSFKVWTFIFSKHQLNSSTCFLVLWKAAAHTFFLVEILLECAQG